ncbi:MAG: AN1-type zinc finger domain-containing protein [Candidatus Nezhaarchaeales archaeon]
MELLSEAEERSCGLCGERVDFLTGYRCRRCGRLFCIRHHLPEVHGCPGLRRGPSEEGHWFRPAEVTRPAPRPAPRPSVSATEARDLLASSLALTVAFSILTTRGRLLLDPASLIYAIPYSFVAVAAAFLLHELAHRSLARAMGHWAEYRAWPPGLLLAVASSFLGLLFAAPGAVQVRGALSRRDYGLIALAGPLSNSLVALALKLSKPLLTHPLLGHVAAVSAWLGLFNLIPLPPLDGHKVASWSAPAWAASIALAAAALLL